MVALAVDVRSSTLEMSGGGYGACSMSAYGITSTIPGTNDTLGGGGGAAGLSWDGMAG